MAAEPPLIVHAIHHLVIGGMENGVVNLINRIPRERYRHCVVCMEDYSDFRHRIEDQSVPVIAMHKSQLSSIGLYRQLYALFRKLRPAIVHSRNLSGLDALLPAVMARTPCRVHSEHGRDVDDVDGSRLKPRLLRRLHAPMVQRYVTVSKDLQSYLIRRIGVSPERIAQIYNGVDTARFVPVTTRPAGCLPENFAGDDQVVVGTVGRLQPIKNQLALVRSLGRLVRQNAALRRSVRLVIVGDGPSREELRAGIAEESLADVAMLTGARADVDQMLGSFDIFALPSLNEGVSNTILEAMATGLPVVATHVGGNPELVLDGVTGTLYASEGSESLERALLPYLTDRALRRSHGQAGRARVEREFSLESMVGRYLTFYDEILKGR